MTCANFAVLEAGRRELVQLCRRRRISARRVTLATLLSCLTIVSPAWADLRVYHATITPNPPGPLFPVAVAYSTPGGLGISQGGGTFYPYDPNVNGYQTAGSWMNLIEVDVYDCAAPSAGGLQVSWGAPIRYYYPDGSFAPMSPVTLYGPNGSVDSGPPVVTLDGATVQAFWSSPLLANLNLTCVSIGNPEAPLATGYFAGYQPAPVVKPPSKPAPPNTVTRKCPTSSSAALIGGRGGTPAAVLAVHGVTCAAARSAVSNGRLVKEGDLSTSGWSCRVMHRVDNQGLLFGARDRCASGRRWFTFRWGT